MNLSLAFGITDGLDWCAEGMRQPFWGCLEELMRAASPLEPGKYGQLNNKILEVARRAICGFVACVVMPSAVMLGVAAMGPRALSNHLQPLKATHLVTKVAPKVKTHPLRIGSGNICFLPSGLPLQFGRVAPAHMRVDQLARKILSMDLDLVCLQETHSVRDNAALAKKLKDSYSEFKFNQAPTSASGLNPGMFVASKYKILNWHDERYDNAPLRSMVDFELWDRNQRIAKVIATHLSPSAKDAAPTEHERILRTGQAQQIERRIEQMGALDCPLIMLGDLNMVQAEFDNTVLHGKFSEGFQGAKPATFDEDLSKPDGQEFAIDYVLLANDPRYSITSSVEKMYDAKQPGHDLSDHHFVVAEVS